MGWASNFGVYPAGFGGQGIQRNNCQKWKFIAKSNMAACMTSRSKCDFSVFFILVVFSHFLNFVSFIFNTIFALSISNFIIILSFQSQNFSFSQILSSINICHPLDWLQGYLDPLTFLCLLLLFSVFFLIVYTIKQTSSRPDGTPPPGSNVGLGLAHSWSHVTYAFQLQPASQVRRWHIGLRDYRSREHQFLSYWAHLTSNWARDNNHGVKLWQICGDGVCQTKKQGIPVKPPSVISGLRLAESIKMLGVTISRKFSFSHHVDNLLAVCSQSLFALQTLRQHGLPNDALHQVFQAMVINRLTGMWSRSRRLGLETF